LIIGKNSEIRPKILILFLKDFIYLFLCILERERAQVGEGVEGERISSRLHAEHGAWCQGSIS